MCGIVAVRGHDSASDAATRLKSLEYRGYDSAGIAVLTADNTLLTERAVGPVDALMARLSALDPDSLPSGLLAIGHTRWATHGTVSVRNTHPLVDCTGRIAVVHNGILSNAAEVRAELAERGHLFSSDVDSEVIAHLLESALQDGATPFEAMQSAVGTLRGSWAIAALVAGHNAILVARSRSPLMVRGSVGRCVVASDVAATAGIRGPLRVLADGDVAELGTSWHWMGTAGPGRPPAAITVRSRRRRPVLAVTDPPPIAPGSATAAEIAEQTELVGRLVDQAATRAASAREWHALALPRPHRVILLGCGTSYHSCLVTARVLRTVAGLPAQACIASEFDTAASAPFDLAIVMSQSGETADVLAAMESIGTPVLAVTNSLTSSIARAADAVVDCDAGPERGVAATKTFTSQVLRGVHIAFAVAHAIGAGSRALGASATLQRLPERFAVAAALGSPLPTDELAEAAAAAGWIFLGTGSGLPYAAEGALKLKELSYRWAEHFPAGELKHGPLALVSEGTPAVIVDNGSPRLASATAELRSRGAAIIVVDRPPTTAETEFDAWPPWGPLEAMPRLQHLAVAVATALGRDIDRPRNLAKSVTVT